MNDEYIALATYQPKLTLIDQYYNVCNIKNMNRKFAKPEPLIHDGFPPYKFKNPPNHHDQQMFILHGYESEYLYYYQRYLKYNYGQSCDPKNTNAYHSSNTLKPSKSIHTTSSTSTIQINLYAAPNKPINQTMTDIITPLQSAETTTNKVCYIQRKIAQKKILHIIYHAFSINKYKSIFPKQRTSISCNKITTQTPHKKNTQDAPMANKENVTPGETINDSITGRRRKRNAINDGSDDEAEDDDDVIVEQDGYTTKSPQKTKTSKR